MGAFLPPPPLENEQKESNSTFVLPCLKLLFSGVHLDPAQLERGEKKDLPCPETHIHGLGLLTFV
jgi:hypothetical protein